MIIKQSADIEPHIGMIIKQSAAIFGFTNSQANKSVVYLIWDDHKAICWHRTHIESLYASSYRYKLVYELTVGFRYEFFTWVWLDIAVASKQHAVAVTGRNRTLGKTDL